MSKALILLLTNEIITYEVPTFFDVSKFPTMTLELIRANDQSVEANLTIKGISKHVLLSLKTEEVPLHPMVSKKQVFQ